MCCWPCILVMIKFKFQLNAQYFIPIVMFLYMFRAPFPHPQEDLCISTTSGSMSVSFGDLAVGRLVRDSLTFRMHGHQKRLTQNQMLQIYRGPPEDGSKGARNMQRNITIGIKYCALSWNLNLIIAVELSQMCVGVCLCVYVTGRMCACVHERIHSAQNTVKMWIYVKAIMELQFS